MNPLSPLLLQAQIAPPAGGGSFGLADSTRLENPFQAPMWLDEIRFRLPTDDGSGSLGTNWSSFSIELKLGELPLTKGFVPISLFGKVLNDSPTYGENGNEIGGLGISRGAPGVFTWRLPKPLFIPAREFLRPTMYFQPVSGATTKVVTICYCCRPLPKGTPTPRVLQIPWVTSYVPQLLTASAIAPPADTTDQSTPADLYNPWTQDMHVQRFVGRFMGQALSGEDSNNMSIASARVDPASGEIISGTLVSAQDSFNNILIRDRTPFAHVFDYLDRSWTVNAVLPPKGFYLFTIDRLWSAYAPAAPFTATVGIGMVGWREVQYVQGALR